MSQQITSTPKQNPIYLNWTNILFFTLTPLVGILGTYYAFMYDSISWPTYLLVFTLTIFSGLSITCGYHRLYSHRSYEAHWTVQLFFLFFGAAAFEGSALEWCSDHRNHHRYTDTDKDPYNAKRGFWYSHLGWIFQLDTSKRCFDNVPELKNSKLLAFQHRYYVPIAVFGGFIFPMLLCSLWHETIAGLFFAGALRITLTQQFTFCINSVCHIFGKTTYSDRDTARDNWFTALFTYGEGYHNFHHRFPIDYRNGIRIYDFDPSKWLIRGLAYIGLTKNLKTVSQQRIIECQIKMAEQQLQASLEKNGNTAFVPVITQAYEAVLSALAKLEKIESHYQQIKSVKYVNGKLEDYKKSIQSYRLSLKESQKELKASLKAWSAVVMYVLKQLPSSPRLN